MSKFHINAKGVPAPCRAKEGNCPFGGMECHYNSIEEAQVAADRINEDEHGYLPPVQSLKDEYEKKFNHYTNKIKSSKSLIEEESWRTKLAELSKRNKGQDKVQVSISDVLKNVSEPDGGATIALSSEYEITTPTTGFCASPYPEHSKMFDKAQDVTFESMMEFMNVVRQDDRNILEQEDTYIGLWNDPETGKVYLDISKRYHTSKEARIACEDNDQIAYFDLQLFESVDVDRNATSGQILV